MSDDVVVPDGWSPTTLGKIGRYLNGRAFKSNEWSKTGRPIIRIQDLTGSNRNPNYFEGEVDDRYVVRPGDFLISWSATLGAYIWDGPEGVLNQHIFKVESDIDKRFHYHLVRERIAELERNAHGSGMVHVTKGIFDNTPIAVPDDKELQRRIADIIDRADTLGDSASSHLAAARRAIERFRQAVLAAACSGRLTADWRLTHALVDGDDLPGGWAMAFGREVFPFVTSGSRGWAKYYTDSGPTFIRVGNLDHDSLDLDLSEIQRVTPPENAEARRTAVLPGDLLISITAEIGMVGVAPDDLGPAHVNQHVAIARPDPTNSSRYLACFITALTGGQEQLGVLQRGATKAGLGLDDLRALRIPIPPRAEQDEIVRRVEHLLSLADGLKKRIDAASKRVDRSSQAILAKAFRGELVTSVV